MNFMDEEYFNGLLVVINVVELGMREEWRYFYNSGLEFKSFVNLEWGFWMFGVIGNDNNINIIKYILVS